MPFLPGPRQMGLLKIMRCPIRLLSVLAYGFRLRQRHQRLLFGVMIAASLQTAETMTQPGAPIPYSEDPGSDFYKQVNDLYQASKVLTTDQKNQALFWRDVPGVSTPGHWMSITQQAIRQSHSRLDKAAAAYALVGICLNDAVISVFHYKYIYHHVRPDHLYPAM